jgi:hypothetical protein
MSFTAESVSSVQQLAIDVNRTIVDEDYNYIKNLSPSDPMAAIMIDILRRLHAAEAKLQQLDP